MDIEIRKKFELDEAIKIAEKLPDFFMVSAIEEMRSHWSSLIAYGAYHNEKLIGWIAFTKKNEAVTELNG